MGNSVENRDEAALQELSMQLAKLSSSKEEQARLLEMLLERIKGETKTNEVVLASNVGVENQPITPATGGVETSESVETHKLHPLYEQFPYLAEIDPEFVRFISERSKPSETASDLKKREDELAKELRDVLTKKGDRTIDIDTEISDFKRLLDYGSEISRYASVNPDKAKVIEKIIKDNIKLPFTGKPDVIERNIESTLKLFREQVTIGRSIEYSNALNRALKRYKQRFEKKPVEKPAPISKPPAESPVSNFSENAPTNSEKLSNPVRSPEKAAIPTPTEQIKERVVLVADVFSQEELEKVNNMPLDSMGDIDSANKLISEVYNKILTVKPNSGEKLVTDKLYKWMDDFGDKIRLAEGRLRDNIKAKIAAELAAEKQVKDAEFAKEIRKLQEVRELMFFGAEFFNKPNASEATKEIVNQIQARKLPLTFYSPVDLQQTFSNITTYEYNFEADKDQQNPQGQYLGYSNPNTKQLFLVPLGVNGFGYAVALLDRLVERTNNKEWGGFTKIKSVGEPIVLTLKNEVGSKKTYTAVKRGKIELP